MLSPLRVINSVRRPHGWKPVKDVKRGLTLKGSTPSQNGIFGESNVSIRVDVAVCGVKLKSIWARRLFVQPKFIYFRSNIGALKKSHGPEFPKHDHCSGLTSHRKAEAF